MGILSAGTTCVFLCLCLTLSLAVNLRREQRALSDKSEISAQGPDCRTPCWKPGHLPGEDLKEMGGQKWKDQDINGYAVSTRYRSSKEIEAEQTHYWHRGCVGTSGASASASASKSNPNPNIGASTSSSGSASSITCTSTNAYRTPTRYSVGPKEVYETPETVVKDDECNNQPAENGYPNSKDEPPTHRIQEPSYYSITTERDLSLIHISEPTRLLSISYAVFCLKKKNRFLQFHRHLQ
eukprot:TRINITY_DN959_c0_g3_i8.p1 TRINITY_DN959_c0_g3~~TRINITY_DN959_c0_g3_i8.p1  ORF type:complete len:239 (-),score=39.56 TRINITY_DN959_c0_g3_i8:7-723(-)